MKIPALILLMFVSTYSFSQSGYYYFTSIGKVREGSQPKRQVYVSYEFYSDIKPICPTIYLFLDQNFPHFDYSQAPGNGCVLAGPFTTQEEAKKARERHADRFRNYAPTSPRITDVIYKEKRTSSIEASG